MGKFDDPISTEPAQIAAQLITQGLPQAIAQSVLTTGVQTVDQPVTLRALTPLNGGAKLPAGAQDVFTVPTAETQTLELGLQFPDHVGVGNVPPSCAWFVVVDWDLGNGLYGLRQTVALYSDADDHQATVAVKCLGVNAQVTVINNTGVAQHCNVQANGSQRVIDRPLVRQVILAATGWSVLSDESVGIITNLQANAGTNLPIPIHPGPARIALAPNAPVTTGGRFALLSHTNTLCTDTFAMPVNGNQLLSVVSFQANLPLAPCFIDWLVTPVGPTNIACSVMWEA